LGWFFDGKIQGKTMGKPWENGKIHGKIGKPWENPWEKPWEWENHLEMEGWMGQCLGFFLRPSGGVLEIKTQIRSIDLDDLG
jgi:hypothetical protein